MTTCSLWRPQGESNPRCRIENPESLPLDDGDGYVEKNVCKYTGFLLKKQEKKCQN